MTTAIPGLGTPGTLIPGSLSGNTVPTLGGTHTGTVVVTGTTTTGGTLTISDPDSGEAKYQATSGTLTYGSFTLATTGVWLYTLNTSDADTLALTTGQVVSDVFTATSNDGTASQNVTITVRESPVTTTVDRLNLTQLRHHLSLRM